MPAASNPSSSPKPDKSQPCKHPRVQVVARNDDQEFVECIDCREVFDSSEFQDMSIEEEVEDENG